jgi:hypothetical protein
MFDVPVPEATIKYVDGLLAKYNFGKRSVANGNFEQQWAGMIGQTIIQEMMGCGKPTGEGGFDGGIDFVYRGLTVDVKTALRNTESRWNFPNNFMACQLAYKTDIVLFTAFNRKVSLLTVLGWIWKKEIEKKGEFHKKGDVRNRDDGTALIMPVDTYEIHMEHLHQVDSVEDLKRLGVDI